MCGITFCIEKTNQPNEDGPDDWNELFQNVCTANAARGPDAQETATTVINDVKLTFFASELHLRGSSSVTQPHRDAEGNILCWNGEVFGGIQISADENDGKKLFALLKETNTSEDVRSVLGNIEGPYAIVFYHHNLGKLFFARDPLGRRSLLIHLPTNASPRLLLASVSAGSYSGYALDELSTEFIHCMDVNALVNHANLPDGYAQCLQTLPRQDDTESLPFAQLASVNRTVPIEPPLAVNLDLPSEILVSVADDLISHLEESVRLRVVNIPQRPEDFGKARVAVLFSGGIDSTMLAFLAHRHVDSSEPIDLLNVAFENPRKIMVQAEGNIGGLPKRERKQKLREPREYSTIDITYHVPDRATGLLELEELRRLCPGRIWNFVEVNVPFDEYQASRTVVENLMFPRKTVMDLSLAAALYFAARGIGQVRNTPDADPRPYTSTARVLLNGLGSDELLGGYGRFRTAFRAGGWQAIVDELQLELDRIPTRNLGRDDRVISSHGKETRHPFLSLSVVAFLAQLPVHLKVDPRLEAGVGEKILLRIAARKVGLVEASNRKKRAMQFGSHSARMIPGDGDRKGDILLPE